MAADNTAGNDYMVQLSTLATFLRSEQDTATVLQALQSQLQQAHQVAIQNEDGSISVVDALPQLQPAQTLEVHGAGVEEAASVGLVPTGQAVEGNVTEADVASQKYLTESGFVIDGDGRTVEGSAAMEEGEVVEERQVGMRDGMATQTTYMDTMDGSEIEMQPENFITPRMNEVNAQFMTAPISGYSATNSNTNISRQYNAAGNLDKVSCDECEKSFRRVSYLIMHKKAVHSSVKPYKCDICQQTFTSSWGLKMHATVHSDVRPFVCQLCPARFKRNYELNKHMAFHVKDRSFICNVCGKAFNIERSLRKHMFTHMKDTLPFMCDFEGCDKRFHSMPRMREHYTIVHIGERNYACPTCSKMFKRMSDVRTHVKCVHGEKPYACNVCPKKFPTEGMLIRHQQAHSETCDYSCTLCNKEFREQKSLAAHNRMYHRPFPCTQCRLSFVSAEKLAEHYENHPLPKKKNGKVTTKGGRFQCPNCPKFFLTEANLQAHTEKFCRRDVWQCGECTKDWPVSEILCSIQVKCEKCSHFFLGTDIQTHILNKHSFKPKFMCDLCETNCKSEEALDMHVLTCTGQELPTMVEGEFSCEYCDRSFQSRRYLDLHCQKMHFSTSISYKCLECDREFKRKDSLKTHLWSHYTKKSTDFACHLCDKTYKKKRFLEKHLKTHEGEMQEQEDSVVHDGAADHATADNIDGAQERVGEGDSNENAGLHVVDTADDAAKKAALLGNNVVVIKVEELDLEEYGLQKDGSSIHPAGEGVLVMDASDSEQVMDKEQRANNTENPDVFIPPSALESDQPPSVSLPNGEVAATPVLNETTSAVGGVVENVTNDANLDIVPTSAERFQDDPSVSMMQDVPDDEIAANGSDTLEFEERPPTSNFIIDPTATVSDNFPVTLDNSSETVNPAVLTVPVELGGTGTASQDTNAGLQVQIGAQNSIFVNGQAVALDEHTSELLAAIVNQYTFSGGQ